MYRPPFSKAPSGKGANPAVACANGRVSAGGGTGDDVSDENRRVVAGEVGGEAGEVAGV